MRNSIRFLFSFAVSLGALLPAVANAWWNSEWQERTRITLNTSSQGLETREAVNGVAIAVRLHSGNFDFTAAKLDGSDLRVIAGDDKTPLRFSVERFDGINELAVLWVQVPVVAPGSEKNAFYVYAANPKAVADTTLAGGFDTAMLAAIHFSDKEARGADHNGVIQTAAPIPIENNGLLAASARLDGSAIVWPASDKLQIQAGGAVTLTLWVRPDAVAGGTLLQWGPLTMSQQAGAVAARIGQANLVGGEIKPATWTQVGLTIGAGNAVLYVNGTSVAQAAVNTPALSGEMRVGQGVQGLAEEIQIANTVRSADWLRVASGAQGAESRLVASLKETGQEAAAEGQGYIGILVKNLTLDAWIVIGILGVMFVIAAWVMFSKTISVTSAEKANRRFMTRYRAAKDDLLLLHKSVRNEDSPLFRLYEAGVRELEKRNVGHGNTTPLSGASLDAVKAAVDADSVRESQRLNSQMVLLTIAISGGPFLGLLGTVVGVMITFAAIAAAGDVNVNAIAPGIAAALLATVAGLAVAIPALFGYNYLASKIKNISNDMQIFIDEFITRVAELYGAR